MVRKALARTKKKRRTPPPAGPAPSLVASSQPTYTVECPTQDDLVPAALARNKKTGHTATGRACMFLWSQVLSPPRQLNVMSKTIWLGRQSPEQEASFDRLMHEWQPCYSLASTTVRDRTRIFNRGSGSICNVGPQRGRIWTGRGLMTTRKREFSCGKTYEFHCFCIARGLKSLFVAA